MASNHQDDFVQARRIIKHRFFQIPSDQRKLLEDNSSWSQRLTGQYGMMNLPSKVLQDIKDQVSRKHTKLQTHPNRNREASAKKTSPIQRSSSPADSNTSQISWSQSPPRGQVGQGRQSIQSGQSGQSEEQQTPLPRQHHRLQVRYPLLVNDDEPASGGLHSDGLELELPDFMSQAVQSPPVNKAALQVAVPPSKKVDATPPSAQMPVGTDRAGTNPHAPKKRRIMEEIGWDKSPSSLPSTEHLNKTILKPLPENRSSYHGNLITSASANPQRSQRARQQRKDGNLARSDPVSYQDLSRWTFTWEGGQRNTPSRSTVLGKEISPGFRIPSLLTHPPPAQKPSPLTQQMQPTHWACNEGATPYEVFKATYPDYSENCRKFVSACLSLNQLRRERQIPEFLYDDYVRAHSSDYLLYISECDRKKVDKILPAIQWYNDTAKDIQYFQRVIRKDNVTDILAAHADEARAVRRSLGDSQSTESDSNAEDSDEEMEDVPSADEQEADEFEEQQPGSSPELHIKSPGPVAHRAVSTPMQGQHTANDRHTSSKKRGLSQSPITSSQMKNVTFPLQDDTASKVSAAAQKHTISAPIQQSKAQSSSRLSHGSANLLEPSGPVPSSPPLMENRSNNRVMAVTSGDARAQHAHRSLPPTSTHDSDEDEDSEEDAFEPSKRASTLPAAKQRPAAASPQDKVSSTAPLTSKFKPANRGTTSYEAKATSLGSKASTSRADHRQRTVAPAANTGQVRKRVDESPAERSKNFKAFLKQRQGRAPSSTMPSKMSG